MAMCKGCGTVVPTIEIKEGLCQECQSIGTLEDIEQLKREKEEEKIASKGELLYEFYSKDYRLIAGILIGLGAYLMYIYYSTHSNSILFAPITMFVMGIYRWVTSAKSLLKIYSKMIEVEGVEIFKEIILEIQTYKEHFVIITDNNKLTVGLESFEPNIRAEISKILENYMTSEESNISLVNKEKIIENSPFVEEDDTGMKQVIVVTVVVVFVMVAIKLFILNH